MPNHNKSVNNLNSPNDYTPQGGIKARSFISWQKHALFLCKRGNLETELLLQSYIHSLKPTLTNEKIELINNLLQESEQNLFHWLLLTKSSNTKPVNPLPNRYVELISEIRDNYLN
ncbi:succinate dehydrogenase assembly factor 2 [Thiomicrorhabdus lithotrophica]|uniref:succinate dehydrogenase assembly factor 2 n=1 Tax=Thiomicrorhabdus lithotrophica TaxID=2949997 RepID=UPI0037DDB531